MRAISAGDHLRCTSSRLCAVWSSAESGMMDRRGDTGRGLLGGQERSRVCGEESMLGLKGSDPSLLELELCLMCHPRPHHHTPILFPPFFPQSPKNYPATAQRSILRSHSFRLHLAGSHACAERLVSMERAAERTLAGGLSSRLCETQQPNTPDFVLLSYATTVFARKTLTGGMR